MESYKFRLKDLQSKITPSKQKETILFLYFSYGYYELTNEGKKKYKPLKISTGLKLYPYQWNESKQQMKSNPSYDYRRFNSDLASFLSKVKEVYYSNPKVNPVTLRGLINEYGTKPIKSIHLMDYIDKYIDEIEYKKRMTVSKGKPFSDGMVKIMKTFREVFKEYIKERKLSTLNYSDINMLFYKDYVSFLSVNKEYSRNNQGKHIKGLKMIMKASMDEGCHNEIGFQHRGFKVLREDVKSVYLNEKQLEDIKNVDLSEMAHLEEVRDIFLVGCYIAQRYSDYSRITKENIKDGFIHLKQEKTEEEVIIPINSYLRGILKKYNNKLPYVYLQRLNEGIKQVALKAKIPFWNEISSHSARRSGATNMYLAGIPTIDIMKITGHKTEREFLKYISVTKQETAKTLASHPYFK